MYTRHSFEDSPATSGVMNMLGRMESSLRQRLSYAPKRYKPTTLREKLRAIPFLGRLLYVPQHRAVWLAV